MSTDKKRSSMPPQIPAPLKAALGVRRSQLLRRIIRQSGLPPEALIDLALEILDIASRKLSPPPIKRQAIGLGAARWRNVDAQARSEALRRVVQARWAKRKEGRTDIPESKK